MNSLCLQFHNKFKWKPLIFKQLAQTLFFWTRFSFCFSSLQIFMLISCKMKFIEEFIIICITLPVLVLGITKPVQKSCIRCVYRSDYGWINDVTRGSPTSDCSCSSLYPVKVVLAGTNKYCCNKFCPTNPSYTLDSCNCGPSTYSPWGYIDPCQIPGSFCCDRLVGGKWTWTEILNFQKSNKNKISIENSTTTSEILVNLKL